MMSNKVKGSLFIMSSAFCFALMNMFVSLSGDLPSTQKSFFRNIVAAVIAIAVLVKNKESFMWQKGSLPGLLARAVFGTMGIT